MAESLYRSSFKCNINPGGSKTGTCDYCRSMNRKVFKLSQLVPTGRYNGDTGGYGHHNNCVCIFTKMGGDKEDEAKKLASSTSKSLVQRAGGGMGIGGALGIGALGAVGAYLSNKKKKENRKKYF